jgi:hypothetical protein
MTHSIRALLVFVVAIELAACAAQQDSLTAASAASLKGRRIATTARRPTPIFVSEPGKDHVIRNALAGALLVEAFREDAGARIFRENAIADPTLDMTRRLSGDLQHRYGLRLDRESIYITNDDPTQIAAAHPEADLLLDVWIDSLRLEPLADDPSKYHLKYTANLRLIDAKIVHLIDGKKGLVIAHGACTHVSQETPSPPTYDEMLANRAQRLKHELDLATEDCVQMFQSTVLNGEATP